MSPYRTIAVPMERPKWKMITLRIEIALAAFFFVAVAVFAAAGK